MPATDTAEPVGFELDRANHTIRFVRDFAAPRERVFEAWTNPADVTMWWNAAGKRLTSCEIDLRVGGAFNFLSPGFEHPFGGVYLEIDPPALLSFDANGAIGHVRLADHAGGTRMTVEIVCHSTEHLDQFIQIGVANGTSQTLDNLVAHLS
jgi:uncharacterized protein YndB with AHSA1/START domain